MYIIYVLLYKSSAFRSYDSTATETSNPFYDIWKFP